MTREGLRAAFVVAAAVALAAATALALGQGASAHDSECHVQKTCPSDDHSYVWSDGTTIWDCALAPPTPNPAEQATIIEYDGQRYSCTAVPTGTTTAEPPPAAPPPPPTPTTTTRPSRPPPPPAARPKPKPDGEPEVAPAPYTPGPPRARSAALPPGRYVFPVDGPASYGNDFGAYRPAAIWHHGIDIFAPLGTPLLAVADGTLLKVGWNAVGGNRLWIRDRWGNYFYYAHLSGFAPGAVSGAPVIRGEVVGYVGNTGDAVGTPYHLHFEIHPASMLDLGYDGVVNPYPHLQAWQRAGALVRAGGTTTTPSLTPGAILLTASDISSASGLEPETVVRSATAPVTVERSRRLLPALPAPTAAQIAGRDPRAASYASVLDSAASSFGGPAGATVWDTLAQCESSGDWHANTGIYDGGLQFHPGTWTRYGGAAFAPYAYLATREQQITIARRVLGTEGWEAWPACSLKLGLR